MNTSNKATLCGVGAILLWSLTVAFMRSVAESFGASGGPALGYTVASLLLLVKSRGLNLGQVSAKYLFGCGALFVLYSVLFALAVGLSDSSQQTLEIALVNYLWPCFIIVIAIPLTGLKVNWLLFPGLALSFMGVCWCLSEGTLDVAAFAANVRGNPIPYALAFVGAFCWGVYCNVARLYGQSNDCLGVFFLAIAVVLWIGFLLSSETMKPIGIKPYIDLVLLAIAWASSYALWEKGVQKGNLTLLAAGSYCIPVLSILFAALWLSAPPPFVFWYGVVMVVAGALLCWAATSDRWRKK